MRKIDEPRATDTVTANNMVLLVLTLRKRWALGGVFLAPKTPDFSMSCEVSFCPSAIEGHSGVFVIKLVRQRASF